MDFILFVFICWFCGAIFVLLGFSCLKRRTPTGFWSGVDIKAEDVTDVRGYNVANGIMWCAFSTIFWLSGIAAIFDSVLSVILLVFGCTGGVIGLIIGYGWIKRRYFVSYRDKYVASKLNDYK